MRCREYLTELKLESPLPQTAMLWLAVTLLLAALYISRMFVDIIPPEDHVAIALLLCIFLTQVWVNLEQIVVEISLPNNRCWLRHHRMGKLRERSLPVSQIHSARMEYEQTENVTQAQSARIVLVTSLGMIPVSEHYQTDATLLERACGQINSFLQSQQRYLQA